MIEYKNRTQDTFAVRQHYTCTTNGNLSSVLSNLTFVRRFWKMFSGKPKQTTYTLSFSGSGCSIRQFHTFYSTRNLDGSTCSTMHGLRRVKLNTTSSHPPSWCLRAHSQYVGQYARQAAAAHCHIHRFSGRPIRHSSPLASRPTSCPSGTNFQSENKIQVKANTVN